MFHKNATLFGKVVTSCRKRRTKGRRSGGSEQRQGAEKQKYGYLKKGIFLIVHALNYTAKHGRVPLLL